MCDHPISVHLRRSRAFLANSASQHHRACEVYDAYASTLYDVMLRVVECEDCAIDVLSHSLLTVCAADGPKPTLTVLLRASFSSACAVPDNSTRKELKARIREWYLEGSVLHSLPEPLAFDPASSQDLPCKGAA